MDGVMDRAVNGRMDGATDSDRMERRIDTQTY